jgi:acyl carrier protein
MEASAENAKSAVARDLALALIRRFGDHFSIKIDPVSIDPDVSLLDHGSLMLDGHPLDSLDLVDAMVGLENELGVRLTDGDLQELDTFNRLAGAILRTAKPEDVREFCVRWQ